jgi:hypothetical protein
MGHKSPVFLPDYRLRYFSFSGELLQILILIYYGHKTELQSCISVWSLPMAADRGEAN